MGFLFVFKMILLFFFFYRNPYVGYIEYVHINVCSSRQGEICAENFTLTHSYGLC